MNFIQNIEFIHSVQGNPQSFVEHLGINCNSLIGLCVVGHKGSLIEQFKTNYSKFLVDGIDIFAVYNRCDDEFKSNLYAWINDRDTLIENCTIIENLELATRVSEGRSPQLLLKQMDVEAIADLFPRQLSCYNYLMASILSALARGCRYIFVECSFEGYSSDEIVNIVVSLKKCNDYFERTVFLINPDEILVDKIDALYNFRIEE